MTMEFTCYTLPNGIRCIHKQVRSAVVNCALTVNTGSRDEEMSEQGLAHLLEHAFFKGTTHRKAFHINCRLENLGGELNAYTTKEETVVHATTLRGDFAKAAELIMNGDFGYMVSVKNNKIDKTPLQEVAGRLKMVEPDSDIVKEAKTIGISFGD